MLTQIQPAMIGPKGICYVYKSKASTEGRLHINRIAGGDRNYRDPGGDVVASAGQGEGEGPENELPQQPAPNGVRIVVVCG